MKYAYQRGGGPILDWTDGPPSQSRTALTASLGSLGGTTLDGPTLVLPRPGAPEPVDVTGAPQGMSGCSCTGTCGCGKPLSGLVDAVPGGYVTLGVAAVAAWLWFRGRRGRR